MVYLTAGEMAEVDRAAIERFGMPVLVLMENAGVAVATAARAMLGGSVEGRRISCQVGRGNNGGDGLVAARHLRNWGARVSVILGGSRAELHELPAKQMMILEKMGVRGEGPDAGLGGSDLLVDALLGYNARGDPKGPLAELIHGTNSSGVPTIAVDLPSGLDATTGEPSNPCVVAARTVTFAFPKTGFLNPKSRRSVGELYVADISVPEEIYRKYSQGGNVFAKSALVKVW